MFRKWFAVLLLWMPTMSFAALLQYDLAFETYDSEHLIGGTGYFIADTNLDAIVGARLESDAFVFSWEGTPAPLNFVEKYYGADIVFAGDLYGMDLMTGEAASLNLNFLLLSASGDGLYADELDSHLPEDIWSMLQLPAGDRPDGHWLNSPLRTHFTLSTPFDVTPVASVAEPSAMALLAIGGVVVAIRRKQAASAQRAA